MSLPWLPKRILFRTHWLLGLTAGLVLALVGVTGAMLGFEAEIVDLLNPQLQVAPRGAPLTPDQIIARVRAQQPTVVVAGFTWKGAQHAVELRLDGGRDAGSIHVNPYDARVLAGPRGQQALGFIEQLHRNLAGGPVGKQIVAASTVALLLLALSGIALRWPRRWRSPRAWLRLDSRLRGRSFLWHLHAITATWVLPLYLIAALTGLWWSYDFYRNAVNALAGVTQQQRGPGPGGPGAPPPPPPLSVALDPSWRALLAQAPTLQRATLVLPRQQGASLEWRYLAADAAHERAFSTLRFDPRSGQVLAIESFDALPLGRRAVAAIFPLHSGSYFGVFGRSVMALASLLMPLFAVTGIWLWLKRRREGRAARIVAVGLDGGCARATVVHRDSILVVHASQGGTSERLAWLTAQWLHAAGMAPRVQPLRLLDPPTLAAAGHALFVVSTYGDGDPPDAALDFARRWMRDDSGLDLGRLRCAVLALGNRRYADFCAFGQRTARWLATARAHFMFDVVEAHDGNADDVARWRDALSRTWPGVAACGDAEVPLVADSEAGYDAWRLYARSRVDPDDHDARRVEVQLQPPAGQPVPGWQPGDTLDVRIAPDAAHIDAWLADWQLAGAEMVHFGARQMTLAAALGRREPPRDPTALRGLAAQAVIDRLAPLSARSYSIASVPADGVVTLLARISHDAQGLPGLASSALGERIAIGSSVGARIHRSVGFEFPSAPQPMVLIGNGVGIAPFIAALKSRERTGGAPSWLLHGERSSRHFAHLHARIAHWQSDGTLERFDLCRSREGKRMYVQDALSAQGDALQRWLERGASIMVCGSPGMGAGVDAVLVRLLGMAAVAALREQRRYRRELF